MKYRVTLSAKKLSDPDRKVQLIAVSAINAKEIADMRYKNFNATEAVRLGTAPPTQKVLETLVEDFISALDEGNKDLAKRHEKAFYETFVKLQSEMDVVAFNLAKKHLPSLPPLGK